jgi:predicted transcriptional regulator
MANESTLIELTADIVAAHVSNNTVAVGDVGNLVQQVHQALHGLQTGGADQTAPKSPVVSVRASEKTLRRHLQSAHGMTPDQYRQDYGLPQQYPMVAANYSDKRREMAKSIGLGRKKGDNAPATKRTNGNGRKAASAK